MSRFEGQKIVVTGGSGGIGKATAERLAKEGAHVLVTGTSEDKLKSVNELSENITAISNDAGCSEDAQRLAEKVKEHFGTVDSVFLNAGYGMFTPHTEATAEDFDKQYAVNVRGPILHARLLSPLLNEGGNMVLTTSVATYLGMEGGILYNSTKGALRTIVRVLASELAERQIRVNAVAPGPIDTGFFKRTDMDEQQLEEMTEQIKSQVPLGRFGTAEEIAAVVLFLMSDDASYVTGAEFTVDGGMIQV